MKKSIKLVKNEAGDGTDIEVKLRITDKELLSNSVSALFYAINQHTENYWSLLSYLAFTGTNQVLKHILHNTHNTYGSYIRGINAFILREFTGNIDINKWPITSPNATYNGGPNKLFVDRMQALFARYDVDLVSILKEVIMKKEYTTSFNISYDYTTVHKKIKEAMLASPKYQQYKSDINEVLRLLVTSIYADMKEQKKRELEQEMKKHKEISSSVKVAIATLKKAGMIKNGKILVTNGK